jgi:acyl-CoA dehydrogenase
MASRAEDMQAIRENVRALCWGFPATYWREIDKKEEYPQDFVKTLTESEYLAVLIPEEYGGSGLGITEAGVILEELKRSGGNSTSGHAQIYTMGTLLRHGSEEQKRKYLPATPLSNNLILAFLGQIVLKMPK